MNQIHIRFTTHLEILPGYMQVKNYCEVCRCHNESERIAVIPGCMYGSSTKTKLPIETFSLFGYKSNSGGPDCVLYRQGYHADTVLHCTLHLGLVWALVAARMYS